MASETSNNTVNPEFLAFPGSRKVYLQGSRPDIQVPMREIALAPTVRGESEEENEPVRVYDCSGPYTDANYHADIRTGLPANRKNWILERGMWRFMKAGA